MCQFSPFCYPKVKENKMKPWKRHVLTKHTVCKHCWLICYETDMEPELSTAAADQNFTWICKQHQDPIGLVLIFRTKIIWSEPEFGLVQCGYLNTANVSSSGQRRLWSDWVDVQADLSLRWAHSHFVGFVMSWLKYTKQAIHKIFLNQIQTSFLNQPQTSWHSNLLNLHSALQMKSYKINLIVTLPRQSKLLEFNLWIM